MRSPDGASRRPGLSGSPRVTRARHLLGPPRRTRAAQGSCNRHGRMGHRPKRIRRAARRGPTHRSRVTPASLGPGFTRMIVPIFSASIRLRPKSRVCDWPCTQRVGVSWDPFVAWEYQARRKSQYNASFMYMGYSTRCRNHGNSQQLSRTAQSSACSRQQRLACTAFSSLTLTSGGPFLTGAGWSPWASATCLARSSARSASRKRGLGWSSTLLPRLLSKAG